MSNINLINKSDYLILEVLIGNDFNTAFKSCSKEYLSDVTGYSLVKISNTIKMFIINNMIMEGFKDGKRKTYYVTQLGIDNYKSAMGYSDVDLEDLINKYAEEDC